MKLRICFALGALAVVLSQPVRAQTTVELISGRSEVSGGHGSHTSTGLRVRHQRARDIWYLGVSLESRFGDEGWLGNISNTHTFNQDWSSHVSATTSADAFFLPRYQFDAQLSRRLGARRAWVITGSAMTRAAQDEHRDLGAGIGVLRFFRGGLAAETSVFWTRTLPEDIITRRQHVGLMWFGQRRQLSARVGFGKESYLPVTQDSVLVAFDSYDVTVRWLEPITPATAIAVAASYYYNPHYRSRGYSVTVVQRLGR